MILGRGSVFAEDEISTAEVFFAEDEISTVNAFFAVNVMDFTGECMGQEGVMAIKKLAVIFPGIGYTADRPLLHYSRRIAADHGYEIRIMNYSGFPRKIKGDRKRMEESFEIALQQSMEMLSDVAMSDYEDILFIGKSIGTIAAAKIASESPARDRIRLVLYTPLEDTFAFSFGEAIAFTGDDDPWVGREKSRILAICESRGIPCALLSSANHSLESSDVFADMKELYRVMKETERFILE